MCETGGTLGYDARKEHTPVHCDKPPRLEYELWGTVLPSGSPTSVIIGSGDNVIRIQVSLDEEEYSDAKKEAEALGISVAELVRRALRQMLPPRGNAPWMRFAGFTESGDPRFSQTIDDLIYGPKD